MSWGRRADCDFLYVAFFGTARSPQRHRAHFLITAQGGSGDPVQRGRLLTGVAAVATEQPGVVAVYWPEGGPVQYPPLFRNSAKTFENAEVPPIYLWIDLRVFGNRDGKVGLFTQGLSALGHMEIEIPCIAMERGEFREWLFEIICYLLEKGPVLKDGDTIGMSANQRIRVRHRPSQFGHPGTVICLEP